MDIAIILLAAGILIGFVVLAFKSQSFFVAYKTAKSHKLNPTFAETVSLSKFYELEESFLNACAAFKRLDPCVSISEIVDHHMADGDTIGLLDKWSELRKRNLTLPFESAILYDLSGKDIIAIASQSQQTHTLSFDEILDKMYRVQFNCQFRISPESIAWINPDLSQYKDTVLQKINNSINQSKTADLETIQSNILNHTLDEAFWKNLCHGHVINQKLSLAVQ